MFQLDSSVMDATYDDDGGLTAYLVRIGDITIEIPTFDVEAEKRTASVLWIWLSKLADKILHVIEKNVRNDVEQLVITKFTISEFKRELGDVFNKSGYSVVEIEKLVEENNATPLLSPEGTLLIVRDDLHLEYMLDENYWERIITGLAIYTIFLGVLDISEENARKLSFELAKSISSKPKIETHAAAKAFLVITRN